MRKAAAELDQAKQALERAASSTSAQLIPQQTLDDAQSRCSRSRPRTTSALQNARNLRADIDVAERRA